jgi:U4/U6.U5 tri-snRNP-associated protein 3
MWEKSEGDGHSRASRRNQKPESSEHSRRHRSRSRSRDRDADRQGVKRKDRDERDTRDKSRRDRDREEPRAKKRKYSFIQGRHSLQGQNNLRAQSGDTRGRSKSPSSRANPAARQRSPPRASRSARSRERDKDRDKGRDGGTREHRVNGSARTDPPRGPKAKVNGHSKDADTTMTNGIEEDDDDDEQAMKKVMGFISFRSTKNTKVPGNDKNYGVRKEKTIKYRQYMNRSGGFNRPLSPG